MMSPLGGSGNNISSPSTDSSSDSRLKRIKKAKASASRIPGPVVSSSNFSSRSRSGPFTPKQTNIVNSDGEAKDKMPEVRNLNIDGKHEQSTKRFFKQNPRLRSSQLQTDPGTANPGFRRSKRASGSKQKVMKLQVSRRGRGAGQNRSNRPDEDLNQTTQTTHTSTSEISKENAKQGSTASTERTNLGLVNEKEPKPEDSGPVAKRLENVVETEDAKTTVDEDITIKKDKKYCFGFSSESNNNSDAELSDWEKIYLSPVKRKRTVSIESESCQILEDHLDVTVAAPSPSPPSPVSVRHHHNQNEIQIHADADAETESDDEGHKSNVSFKNTNSLGAIIARLTSDLEERDDQIQLLQGQLASSELALQETQKLLAETQKFIVERGRERAIEQDTIEVRGSQRILGPQQLLAEQAAKYKKLQDEFSERFNVCTQLKASLITAERKPQPSDNANKEYEIILGKQKEQIRLLQEELKEMEEERTDFQTQYDALAYSSYHTPSFGFRSGETSHLPPLYPTWPFSGFSYQSLNLKRNLAASFSDESSSISLSPSDEVQKAKRRRD